MITEDEFEAATRGAPAPSQVHKRPAAAEDDKEDGAGCEGRPKQSRLGGQGDIIKSLDDEWSAMISGDGAEPGRRDELKAKLEQLRAKLSKDETGTQKRKRADVGVLLDRAEKLRASSRPDKRKKTDGGGLVSALRRAVRDDGISSDEEDFSQDREHDSDLKVKGNGFRSVAKRDPGVLTIRALQRFREQIEENHGGMEGSELDPIVLRFLHSIFLPNFPVRSMQAPTSGEVQYRELRTTAEAIDFLLRGKIFEALDILTMHFKACTLAIRDKSWGKAKWLQLLPEETTAATTTYGEDEVLRKLEIAEKKLQLLGRGGHG